MTLAQWSKLVMVLGLILPAGCGCDTEDESKPAAERFAHLETADLTIAGHSFRAWLAREQKDITSGLMFVKAEEMKPYEDGAAKSMFFVFQADRSGRFDGFWMKNVPISLDIAFIDKDLNIVSIKTMAAFDTRTTSSDAPYRYALETTAGQFKRLDIGVGDKVEIPDGVLNTAE